MRVPEGIGLSPTDWQSLSKQGRAYLTAVLLKGVAPAVAVKETKRATKKPA